MLYAFDGTWNDDRSPRTWTNVCKLARAMPPARVRYYRGVGNGLDCTGLERYLGGAFGLGFSEIVDRALADHLAARAAGDRVVDVIGFSRGAVAALVFLNKIREWERRSRRAATRIRFVGLFDAVDALGLPDLDWEFWYDKRLAPGVETAVHAVAIHETRCTFHCLDVRGAKQVGFAGDHSDIGGGWPETGLSDLALAWMYDQARAAGLRFAVPKAKLGLAGDPALLPHRVTSFNYAHAPRRFPADMAWPTGPCPWPIMRQVRSAKRGGSGRGADRGERLHWEFIDAKAYTQPAPP